MPKKKSGEKVGATGGEAEARLIDVLQSLVREVETLNQQVGTLAARAEVLTAAIDDVRMELEWTIKNLGRPLWAPTPTSAIVGKTDSTSDPPTENNRQPASRATRTEGKLWD